MTGTLSPGTVSTKRRRIAQLAREMPGAVLTTLMHNVDVEWLREAYRLTRKDGSVGVDGQTAAQYEVSLEANLESLLDRAKSGTYRAPPVRRAFIPKGNGEQRPIGIPTFEDKVLQRAVVMVLESVYEEDFLDCSYGFRPKRAQHQALQAVRNQLMGLGCEVVLELDIRKFFDSVDRRQMEEILGKRVRDGVLLRLIGKWLHAGVQHEDILVYPESGTPQGGVISPLLANIYLHEVLDTWFERDVKPRLKGQSFMVRFADDAVMGFSRWEDARRVMAVLPKRFERYGLTLHPEKTRLVPFKRPPRDGAGDVDGGGPGSFDFLGFTHYWARSRSGKNVVKQKTARGRLRRAIVAAYEWCRSARHLKVREQHSVLAAKVRGHYQYYGVTGNYRSLRQYFQAVVRAWRTWLGRRSQGRRHGWSWFWKLWTRYALPRPRIAHSYVS